MSLNPLAALAWAALVAGAPSAASAYAHHSHNTSTVEGNPVGSRTAATISLETIDGHSVRLKGVHIDWLGDGHSVHGFAFGEADRASARPTRLQIEFFDHHGAALGQRTLTWDEEPSRRGAAFEIPLPLEVAGSVARVRVSIRPATP